MLMFVDVVVLLKILFFDYVLFIVMIVVLELVLFVVVQVDIDVEGYLVVMSWFMMWIEFVVLLKIECIIVIVVDYVKVFVGNCLNSLVMSMVVVSIVLYDLVLEVVIWGRFLLDSFFVVYWVFMKGDCDEVDYVGWFRDMQNWIGGSDYLFCDVLYVLLVLECVLLFMEDFVEYFNCDDVLVMVQVVIGYV